VNLEDFLSESDALTESQLRHQISVVTDGEPTLRDAAKELGVSAQFLGDVIRGRRAVGKTLAAQFAYKPITIYVPIDTEAGR
jgi:hypothetical protein